MSEFKKYEDILEDPRFVAAPPEEQGAILSRWAILARREGKRRFGDDFDNNAFLDNLRGRGAFGQPGFLTGVAATVGAGVAEVREILSEASTASIIRGAEAQLISEPRSEPLPVTPQSPGDPALTLTAERFAANIDYDPANSVLAMDFNASVGLAGKERLRPPLTEQLANRFAIGSLQRDRGLLGNTMRSQNSFDQKFVDRIDRKIAELVKKIPETDWLSPSEVIMASFGQTAEFAPIMIEALNQAAGGAAIGGGIALAVGQIPPFTATPEEAISIPVAMKIGAITGATLYIFKQESGDSYIDMLQKDVSHRKAFVISGLVGSANAALELAQFGTLARFTKKGLSRLFGKVKKEVAEQAVKSAALNEISNPAWDAVKGLGGFVATQTSQEIAQEAVSILGDITAVAIENVGREEKIPQETLEKHKDRIVGTMKASLLGFWALGIPGASATFVGGVIPQSSIDEANQLTPEEQTRLSRLQAVQDDPVALQQEIQRQLDEQEAERIFGQQEAEAAVAPVEPVEEVAPIEPVAEREPEVGVVPPAEVTPPPAVPVEEPEVTVVPTEEIPEVAPVETLGELQGITIDLLGQEVFDQIPEEIRSSPENLRSVLEEAQLIPKAEIIPEEELVEREPTAEELAAEEAGITTAILRNREQVQRSIDTVTDPDTGVVAQTPEDAINLLLDISSRLPQKEFADLKVMAQAKAREFQEINDMFKPTVSPDEFTELSTDLKAMPFIPKVLRETALFRFLKRNFVPAGALPQTAFVRDRLRRGRIRSRMSEGKFAARDFQKALREDFPEGVTTEQLELLDRALKGEINMQAVPEKTRIVLKKMRDHIDALSQALIEEGAVEGELASTIDDNLGTYLTRSYRVHDDPKWAKEIPEDTKNRAKAFIRQQSPELTDDEIDGLIDNLLFNPDAPMALITQSRLGSKDLGILIKRKDIAEPIRALWGERKEPVINYVKSLSRMAHLLENHLFLRDVAEIGAREGFISDRPTGENIAPIATEGSEVMSPLNGKFTTPEIAQAFELAFNSRRDYSAAVRYYFMLNSAVKYAKTVGSVGTHIRNALSNIFFMTANGHWRVNKFSANRALLADLGIADLPLFEDVMNRLGGMDLEAWRAQFREYQELGVVDDSARAGELNDAIRDAQKRQQGIEEFSEQWALTGGQKLLRLPGDLYRAEDDMAKIYGYENELARYTKARDPQTPEQIQTVKQEVAEIITNTYPTYSKIPLFFKELRKFPVVGPFVSFFEEVFRVSYNTVEQTGKELSDPALRNIGVQRLAGIMMVTAGAAGIGAFSRMLVGIGRDDDDDAHKFVPQWSKNSPFVYVGHDEKGNLRYADTGYIDPHSYIKKPLFALLKGEDLKKGSADAVIEALTPMFGEELLAGAIVDIRRNKTSDGRRIWNPQDSAGKIVLAQVVHLLKIIEPGTATSFRRILLGIWGEKSRSGKVYDPVDEVSALITGQRISTVDVKRSLSFQIPKFGRDLRDATQVFSSVARSRRDITDQDMITAYNIANESRRRLFKDTSELIRAARRLGTSEQEIVAILKRSRIGKETIKDLLDDEYTDLQISFDLQKQIKALDRELPAVLQEFVKKKRGRRGRRTRRAR